MLAFLATFGTVQHRHRQGDQCAEWSHRLHQQRPLGHPGKPAHYAELPEWLLQWGWRWPNCDAEDVDSYGFLLGFEEKIKKNINDAWVPTNSLVNCQFPSSHFVDKKAQLSAKKHLILGPPQHLQRVLRDKLFRSGSHLNTSLQGISPASHVWHRRVPHSQIHPTITYHILGYHNLLSITHTIIYIYNMYI